MTASATSSTAAEVRAPAKTRREAELEKRLDPARLPSHLAMIMDGNGRWAKAHGYSNRTKGHEAGIESTRAVVEESARLGVRTLSLYAFGRDNWNRPRQETSRLMRYFQRFLAKERDRLQEHRIRLVHTGCREDLPRYVLKELDRTLELTRDAPGMTLNLAVSYSGREEIAHAARRLAAKAAAGELAPEDITPEVFANHLYRPDLGNPDLLIRTSGERRISDFLVYQMHYAEIYFTPVLWPDTRPARRECPFRPR